MNYLKKLNMVCFSRIELEAMYKHAKCKELFAVIRAKGYSIHELAEEFRNGNTAKSLRVIDSVHEEAIKNKDEIEIFVALFGHLGMYPLESGVCLILRDGIDPRKTPIATLDELRSSIKEDSITDFGIMSDDGLRQFQLKQYKEPLNTNSLFAFIENKINHYGRDLGDTNLLVLLQSEGGNIGDVDFGGLNKKIAGMGIKSEIEILVLYNEENKINVINVVWPTLGTCRKARPMEFMWHSEGR